MATKKKSGMGKGLNDLFSVDEDVISDINKEEADAEVIKNISVTDIEPNKNQPRKDFDKESLDALAESIKLHGVVSPILVTPTKNGTYKIVAGERRWRASKQAGLKEIPCIIRDFEERQVSELALVENLQREDLNPMEEAEGYKYLIEKFNMTQEDISKKIGKSRSAVANSLRLNSLCDEVKEMLTKGELTQGHARALISLDEERQLECAKKIVNDELTVRQAEMLAQTTVSKKPKKRTQNPMTQKYYREVEDTLSSRFGTKVKISEGAKKGKIEIEYYSKDDLERILFELKR